MLFLVLDIALFILGLKALITGSQQFGTRERDRAEGIGARIAGLCWMSPLPTAIFVGLLIGATGNAHLWQGPQLLCLEITLTASGAALGSLVAYASSSGSSANSSDKGYRFRAASGANRLPVSASDQSPTQRRRKKPDRADDEDADEEEEERRPRRRKPDRANDEDADEEEEERRPRRRKPDRADDKDGDDEDEDRRPRRAEAVSSTRGRKEDTPRKRVVTDERRHDDDDDEEFDWPGQRRRSKGSATGLIIGLCVGGVVIVVGLLVLVLLLIRSSNAPAGKQDFAEKPPNPFNPLPIGQPRATDSKTQILGGGLDPVFSDSAPEGGVLAGFEIGLGKFFNNDVVRAARPIYRVGDKEWFGKQYGTETIRVVKVVARPGYAVGALTAKAGLTVDGLSVTFMKVVIGRLDPTDAYESNWIGGKGGNGPVRLGGDGSLVVGLIGKSNGKNMTGMGLLLRPAGGER